jgi:hypothetical protein
VNGVRDMEVMSRGFSFFCGPILKVCDTLRRKGDPIPRV